MTQTIFKYLTVLAALVGGCYAIYRNEAKVGAGLIGFAGLLTDYAELGAFALSAIAKWKGGQA